MFDAAVEGMGPYANYAYFFVGTSYVTYDWTGGVDGSGRVADFGPRPLSEWNLPPPFISGITAAINGAGKFAGKAYFIRDAQYVEYDWATNTTTGPFPLSAWPLPFPFRSGVDDAWSGDGSRAGYGYFLKDDKYLRYRWATPTGGAGSVSAGYPKPFAERRVAGINGFVDAAVNGRQRYQGKAYFFQGDNYSRLSWDTLFGDAPLLPVARNWPGLAELAAVEPARRLSLQWIDIALAKLRVLGNGYPSTDAVVNAALSTHFQIRNRANATTYLPTIRFRFEEIRNRLLRLEDVLRFRTPDEAATDGAGPDAMAYAFAGETVNVTQSLLTLNNGTVTGPRYRAAMITHETGHWVGMVTDHAYEWQLEYNSLPVAKAVENTSSYVFFAQHLESSRDTRGEPNTI